MERDLNRLSGEEFDVLIVGGGIYGAFAAWDASMRGLKVALVEQGDFMSGTSSNSLKILHGGLRYLQDMRPDLVRKMVRERRAMMRVAPHLVRPMPFVLPTRGLGSRSRMALKLALALNDLLSADRNNGLPVDLHLPPGEVITVGQFADWFPIYADRQGANGAALWYDAQILDTERYGITVLKSAFLEGACLANYVRATQILHQDGKVRGVSAIDLTSAEEFTIRAKVVVNACGPWVNELLRESDVAPLRLGFIPSIGMNLVLDDLGLDRALGFSLDQPAEQGARHGAKNPILFLVPWNGCTILGTVHSGFTGDASELTVDWDQAADLLRGLNLRLEIPELSTDDVRSVHMGILPAQHVHQPASEVQLVREGRVEDHRADGLDGLISMLGVKFTCAREVAERAVDLAAGQVSKQARECQTSWRVAVGGDTGSPSEYAHDQLKLMNGLVSQEQVHDLVSAYGTTYREVLADLQATENGKVSRALDTATLLRARVRHAVRNEMALTLEDVVFRRIGIGGKGRPPSGQLLSCADEMGRELGWPAGEVDRQMELAAGESRHGVLVA